MTSHRYLSVLTVLVTYLAACASSPQVSSGSLAVTVSAPAGVAAAVTISGPGGYTRDLSATTTLTGLAPGAYSISARRAYVTGPIVDLAYGATVTGTPAMLAPGGTAASTVSYNLQPGAGALWVLGPNAALKLTPPVLTQNPSCSPATVTAATAIGTGTGTLEAVAFDAAGNLWVAREDSNAIVMYAADQLAASTIPAARLTITATAGSLAGPRGLAFDRSGALWVANGGNSTLASFAPAQLVTSGSPQPKAVITLPEASGPYGIALDANGDLFVALTGSATIARYGSEQLKSSFSTDPIASLGVRTSNGTAASPRVIAFDDSGDLWVATSDYLLEYAASQLVTTGNVNASVTLDPYVLGSLRAPTGIAFDNSGNLWLANSQDHLVVKFAATDLTKSGGPICATALKPSSLLTTAGIAFNPPPADLPLPR